MKRLAISTILLICLTEASEAAVFGPDEDSGFRVQAISVVEYGRYEATGDLTQGPYTSLGAQGFGQGDVDLEWRLSRYRGLRGQLRMVANDSEYRSAFDGLVIERASLRFEDGEGIAPLLIEAGDTFAYFSPRTLFRPLKGVQLELQPALGRERPSSLQLVIGSYGQTWRDLEFSDDLSAGLSWLVEDPGLGRLALSYVHHQGERRQSDGERPKQDVFTLAAEKTLRVGSEVWTLEGELGQLGGDPAAAPGATPPVGADGGNGALFLQLGSRGRSRLSYRLRYESYGQDFLPAGGSVFADRRSVEGHAGLRLGKGAQLRGRIQDYRDFRESSNPATTRTLGIGYSGRLPGQALARVSTNVDAFLNDYESEDGALDTRVWTVSADAYGGQVAGFSPRLRLFLQDRDDATSSALDARIFQVQIGGDRSFGARGFRGTISPGVLVRTIRDGKRASSDWQPTLGLRLERGRHSLQQSLDVLSQDWRTADTVDVTSLNWRLLYRYSLPRDVLSLTVDALDRNPEAALGTTSMRLLVAWTHRLDRRAGALLRVASDARVSGFDLLDLRPGMDFDAARERVRAAGLGEGSRVGSTAVFESRLLADVEQRQRLVLVERDGTLERAGLVIDVEGPPSGSLEQTLAQVRDRLISRYGRPLAFFDQGDFGGDLADTLARGTFARVTEWYGDAGTLRFGIPRRLDGQIRLELQHAAEFPSYGDPLWSIEEVR